MIEEKLLELKDIEAWPSVSIIINTHRSFPDNDQDPILLKNHMRETEERLLKEFEKEEVQPILDNLKMLAERIDHSQNLDSMGIFLWKDRYEILRMPFEVENRVVIDRNPATRDLWRKMQYSSGYYVLMLNQELIRLIEANDGRLVKEFDDEEFPRENVDFHADHRHLATMARGTDNQYREFFNRADKALHKILNLRPMPVVLCGEKRNISYYHEICDDDRHIIGDIDPVPKDHPAEKIAIKAWPVVKNELEEERKEMLEELEKAQNQQMAVSDVLTIFRMAKEGRADTVFVERGFFQPARQKNGEWELIDNSREKGAVDDLVDEIIEQVIRNKGEVVFMEPGELKDYQGMALIARY